jgi:hypothetical protein
MCARRNGLFVGLGVLGTILVGQVLGPSTTPVGGATAFAQESRADTVLRWETVKTNETDLSKTLRRAKIPGGWLVIAVCAPGLHEGDPSGVGLTFVPDSHHQWNGGTLP